MQLGADVGRPGAAEIHAQGRQQPFLIVLREPEILLQAPVDLRICLVIDRNAIRLFVGEGGQDSLLRRHLLRHDHRSRQLPQVARLRVAALAGSTLQSKP